jgi:hypothetical protein
MEYADRNGITGELLNSFEYVIRRVDQEYLALVNAEEAPKKK